MYQSFPCGNLAGTGLQPIGEDFLCVGGDVVANVVVYESGDAEGEDEFFAFARTPGCDNTVLRALNKVPLKPMCRCWRVGRRLPISLEFFRLDFGKSGTGVFIALNERAFDPIASANDASCFRLFVR
ncbi:MAG: hypothetical protein IPG34_16610 [Rhodocyclaceae bacterium]|nr:hypothetical protein [Rhodocyclaceae bacterium]